MRARWPLAFLLIALLGFAAAPSVWRIGEVREGRRLLSTGQALTLDPSAVGLSARGLDMALSADGVTAYVKTTRGVERVDLATGKATATQSLRGGASLCGIDVGAAGVVVTDAQRSLIVFDPATLEVRKTIDLGQTAAKRPCYPCGVRLVGETAYVALNLDNTLATVDLASGTVTRKTPVGIAPYAVAVQGERVFVDCWGRPATKDKPSADSQGAEVETDERGVPTGGTLVETRAGSEVVRRWNVGGQPTEILPTSDAVYVACADADAVFAVSTKGVRQTRIEGLPGAAPSSLAMEAGRLWVALSGENRAMAMDMKTGKTLGSVETGWYPVAVRVGAKGLVVADAKGEGGPNHSVSKLVGAVRQPDAAHLAKPTEPKVARRPRLPIRHAVYVIKENRTYDQLLGDMKEGKGDPSYTMFGEAVTPNHHALAREFVLLDNYACNGSISTDGHAWAVEGQATTFYERSFGGWTRAYPFGGDEPLAISRGGHLWDAALAAGKTFRNYGEFMYANGAPAFSESYRLWRAGKAIPFKAAIGVRRVIPYTSPDFPGWNLSVPDGYRADVFLKEFREMEREGSMPDLVVLYLPQDHTSGDAAGAATPPSMVADNDLAVGRIVEAISRSRFWKDTAVFVTEDDPQAGLDSQDGHRSVCLVASPYTRGRGTVSTFYDQTSVLHTLCEILGAKPYTRFIAASEPMDAVFGPQADLTPYAARPETVPLDRLNPSRASGVKLDLSKPDATDDEAMDRVLWSMAFPSRPFPLDR